MVGCPAMRMAKGNPHDHTTSQVSLPDRLHAATREAHLTLNRSIIARLPLCVPPHTHNPLLYTYGIVAFGQIYFAIERAWSELLNTSPQSCRTSHDIRREQTLATTLQTGGLLRTARLEADIRDLKRRFSSDSASTRCIKHVEEQARTLFSVPVLESIRSKPHVLFAYTWTMYLALFNGGRWIQSQLRTAGQPFWLDTALPDSTTEYPLRFWEFEGGDGGEQIKLDFKHRFQEAAADLTAREMDDVVIEAQKIFATCSNMVHFLDKSVAATGPASVTVRLTTSWVILAAQSWLLVCYSAILTTITSLWTLVARGSRSWMRSYWMRLSPKEVYSD